MHLLPYLWSRASVLLSAMHLSKLSFDWTHGCNLGFNSVPPAFWHFANQQKPLIQWWRNTVCGRNIKPWFQSEQIARISLRNAPTSELTQVITFCLWPKTKELLELFLFTFRFSFPNLNDMKKIGHCWKWISDLPLHSLSLYQLSYSSADNFGAQNVLITNIV